ncbi:MAG: glutamate-5-semialdehyde dehydrogenase [Actinomycetota bacterium]
MKSVEDSCRAAATAAPAVALLSSEVKDRALGAMADALIEGADPLLEANRHDVASAQEARVSKALVDRLILTSARIESMATGLRALVEQPDPVGEVVRGWRRPNGLAIEEVRVPLGVVAVVYEARPNVTADVAGLCLKSGNACVLRGSSMAASSNAAIVDVLTGAATGCGVPEHAIELVGDTSRESTTALMQATGFVDLLIPRGGASLIRSIEENASVPYIIDGAGVCHIYIDESAEEEMATNIIVNAKTQRPSVCNAAETLLVHSGIAASWLPKALDALADLGVEIRGDERVRELWPGAAPATDEDWGTEYLDLVLSVHIVASVDDAIDHINRWGTSNAEAVVCRDLAVARRFSSMVDSGSIFVNASTRFSDGGEFGFGAEIGISTQKLHARGPMGLRALTTTKYVVWGDGQVRD